MRTRNQSKRPQEPSGSENVVKGLDDSETRGPMKLQHENVLGTLTNISKQAVGRFLRQGSSRKASRGKRQEGSLSHGESNGMIEEEMQKADGELISSAVVAGRDAKGRTPTGEDAEGIVHHSFPAKTEETDEPDWEDGSVSISDVREDLSNNLEREVTVEFSESPSSAKRKVIRRASVEDKELAELVHKVHLLCLVGRGRLVDRACDDPLIQVNEFVLYRIRKKMGAKKTNDAPVNEVITKDAILNKIDKVNPPTMKTMTKAYYGNKKRMIKDDAKEKRAAKKTKKAPMINEVSMEDHTSYRIDKANPPIVKTMTEAGCGNWKRMAAIQVDHGKQMNDFVPNENHKNDMVAQKSNKAPINEITAERQVSNLTLEDETNIIQGNKDTFWNQLGDLSIVEDGYPALKLSQSTMGDDSQKMIGKEIKELDNNIPPEVDTWFADFSDSSEENISPEVNTCSTNFIDNSQETTWKELENINWEVDTCPANFNTNYDSPLPSQR